MTLSALAVKSVCAQYQFRAPVPLRRAMIAPERHGRLDILVNNAAAPQGLDRNVVDDVPVDAFDEVIRINLRGTWLMCRAAVPAMRRGRWGRIINVASMAGAVGTPGSTPYSASKAGIIGLTRALAMDVAAWGITVNSISPVRAGHEPLGAQPRPRPRCRRRAGPPGQPSAGGARRHAR